MKKLVFGFALLFTMALAFVSVQAQTTGAIAGTVVDSAGAVVPGATITVKGEAGQEFTATTNSDGVYNIPAVGAGFYTVTVAGANFKTSVVQNVKVDVATPATVNVTLEAGRIDETVVVTSGAEVLQTQTATVGTNIQGRQILETPIQSRDALDLVTLLPGTNTGGVVRTSSINGLPKSALTIAIDGVDVQDNFLKSSDGFFTFVRPRIDAIDEVTVSTSNPGAESSGDGAVQIKFVTRRGTNEYTGSLFWQHRDEGLNANNYYNNRERSPKAKLRLNQFGGRIGGPIPFLNFGEGVPAFTSGKDRAFFFVNYERFHLNESSILRTRSVVTPEAQTGLFRYGTGGAATRDLFALAANTDCDTATPGVQPCPSTIDPTVNTLLNTIRSSTQGTGSFTNVSNIFYRQNFNFSNPGQQRRRFLAARVDLNLTKNHSFENVFNSQPFRSNADFLNSVDPAFPGFANAGTQQSDRYSNSMALRSNFGQNIVNEFRYAKLWGSSNFDLVGGQEFFDNTQRGFSLTLGAGLTNATIRNAYSSRSSPTNDFTDTLTWVKGNHTFNFGGQYKRVETISDSVGQVAPVVAFGIVTGDPASSMFNTTNFPGASATDLTNAAAVYAMLTGRVSTFTRSGILGADGRYVEAGSRHFQIRENTMGLFAQDTWRLRPNLTFNLGLRWQPQTGAQMMTENFSRLVDFDMVYDVSGPGNIFTPGTLTGVVPKVVGNKKGESAFADDWNNLAPSVGVVWSPEFDSGFMKGLFGSSGTSVFRGGFSRAFIREGTLLVENTLGQNPGGSISLSRSTALSNLTIGTLFRTPGNPNLVAPGFNPDPVYPRTLTAADGAFAFDPDLKSGYVDSWSFGYQRQLGRDSVIEVRYVANRGKDMANVYLINEINARENGFGAEFRIAQANVMANEAAFAGGDVTRRYCPGFVTVTLVCQTSSTNTTLVARIPTMGYYGAGTGTAPLPIIMAYFSGSLTNINNPATYTTNNTTIGGRFASSTFVNTLSPANPNILGFAGSLESNFRANGVATGRPVNFFNNCPTTIGFCFIADNSEKSWYDAAVVEFRRRMSSGLRVGASYTFSKAFTNAFASAGTTFYGLGAGDQSNASNNTLRNRDLDKTYAQIDLRHAFKFDATYDLPFGKGRQFFSSSNGFVNALIGGWSLSPVLRWQSGSPLLMEGIQLVGMSAKELQDAVGVYKNSVINGQQVITYLPEDIVINTIRAFNTVVTTPSGYAAGAAPTGRFIAPAGYGNCYQTAPGDCGYRKFVLYGPGFFKLDSSLSKRFGIGEKRNVELRATFYDVLNKTNWRIGNWTGNVNNITGLGGSTFGQLGTGTTYQDPNGSNDPGGRLVDLMLRINF